MNSRPDAWLRQARNDLALAQLARDNGFLAQSCYYASQGAEKALKGALLELGIEAPHTHVLNDLVRRLEEAGLDVGELSELPLRSLSRMAIQSHYPLDATPPSDLFDPGDADQALSCAHQVLKIVDALDGGQLPI
jgi:HEPN domain-containing protein